MKNSNQKRSANDFSDLVRRAAAFAALTLLVPSLPLQAAGTGGTQLFMPQGSAAGTANGDYFSTAAAPGLALPYRYFVEVPSGATRLVVDLFDADWGAGAGEEAANRDRDRGGGGFTGVSTYSLYNPAGTFVTSQTSATFGTDNAWTTLYDSNSPPPINAAVTGVNSTSGSGVTTLSVAVPAGGAGDLLIAVVETSNLEDVTLTGWTSLTELNCGGTATCRLSVFSKTSIASEPSVAPTFDSTKAALGVIRISGANLTPTVTVNGGNSAAPQAPAITGTGQGAILRFAAANDNELSGTPFPAGHTGLLTEEEGGAGDDIGLAAAWQSITGNAAVANFALNTALEWRTATVRVGNAGSGIGISSGHWEVRVDNSASGSDNLNALGIRAHDSNSGGGGTEYPVYYDSHTQIGTNDAFDDGTGVSSRLYNIYPYLTSGCTAFVSTFDFDNGNGTGLGPGSSHGQIGLTSRDGAYTQTILSAALSTDNNWNSNTINRWGSDSSSTGYGLWSATPQIWEYSGGNSNYANVYFRNNPASAAPPPTANPSTGSFRVYLMNDAGGAPVKPYMEQLVTWVSGPNPPTVGNQSIFRVTIRVVNPTLSAITFSTPNNIVTARIPGAGATYGGSPSVSQGTVSAPGLGGTGDITWNPGVIAAGNGDATINDAEIKLLSYLVRVTPTSAGQRVVVTGTPAANGTRGQYVDETGNTSQTRATYLQGPLCELAITQGVLTKALVTEFRAVEERGQVAVEWATTTEDGTTGFDLYRWNAAKSDWDLVNADLVLASPDSIQGGRYRVIDPAAPTGAASTYALMEIEGKGSVRTAGTFTVLPEGAGRKASVFAGDRMAERVAVAPAAGELARLSAARARAASAEAAGLEELAGFVRPPSFGGRLRIGIQEDGLYRLTASDLASRFGVALGTAAQWIATGQLRLEHKGQVVPTFRIRSEAGSVYFYAQAADSIFTATNVYWLSIASGSAMTTTAVAGGSVGAQTFLDRKEVEVDAFAATVVTTDPASDYWFWDYLVGDSATDGQRSFDLQLVDPVAAGDAEITVRLFGATDTGVADEHQAEIRVNGNVVGQTSWQGIAAHEASLTFPASLLVEGSNSIQVTATTGAGAPYSVYYVDGFDLASPRRLRTANARLEFDAGTTSALQVSGFRGGDIALVDVTNPAAPRWATGGKVGRTSDGFGITFLPATAQSRYVAESLAAVRRPASMVLDTPSNLHGSPGAQYVVITDAELAAGAAALASYRAGQGLSTLVVRLQDVYDEFGFGMNSPQAIRDFLAYAWNEWPTAPRYVTFAGEGTYDYRNLGGLGGNKIPALMVSTPDGLFSSDAAYGDVDDDGVVEMAIGRLPVLSPAELAGVVAKIQAYESLDGTWVDQALFVADNLEGATNFASDSDLLQSVLTQDFAVAKVYLDSATPAAAHDAVVAAIQGGTNYVQYLGHGGLDRFAAESMLTNADVAGFTNGGRAPFVAALTCDVNRFELPDYPALGEELVRSATGGATAVFAPSGLSQHGAAREFATRLAAAVYRPETPRLGDALVAAQRAYVGAGGDAELLRTYSLLGDSALRMRPPTPAPSEPGDPSGE